MRYVVAVGFLMLSVQCLAQSKAKTASVDYEAKAKEYIKDRSNDPAQVQFVQLRQFEVNDGLRFLKGPQKEHRVGYESGTGMYVKFRATNGLGVLVIAERILLFGKTGEVGESFAMDDVVLAVGRGEADPFITALLKSK